MTRCPTDIARVSPPVPDMSTSKDLIWHYHTSETLPNIFTSVALRQPNDFCPRFQLNKLAKNAGAIHLSLEEKENTCTRLLCDCSETWSKIDNQMDQFVLNFCGNGSQDVERKYAELYIREMKRAMLKKSKKNKLTRRQIETIKTI